MIDQIHAASKDLLQLVAELSDVAVWEYNFELGKMIRSSNHDKLYGLPWQSSWTIDTFLNATHPEDRANAIAAINKATAPGGPDNYAVEYRVVWSDGSVHWLWVKGRVVKRDESDNAVIVRGTLLDTTARKSVEINLKKLSRLHALLSQSNRAVVHSNNEDDLFQRICVSAVEVGGMKMAWGGMLPQPGLEVKPLSVFGNGTDYLDSMKTSSNHFRLTPGGPSGLAISTGQPVWVQDFLNDPITAHRHELGKQFGWGSMAALPVYQLSEVVGVLVFYSSERNYFDEEVKSLLLEIADDVSFALEAFEKESNRKQTERELVESEDRFRGLVEQSIVGIFIIQDEKLKYVNRRVAEIVGAGSVDELIDTDPLLWISESDRAKVSGSIRELVTGEVQKIALDFRAVQKNGTELEVGANAARAKYQGKFAVVGLVQDISEKKRAEQKILDYVEQLKSALNGTIEMMETLSELRDPYTAGHERRVAKIAVDIANELGLDSRRLEGIRVAGTLHDIGKMMIPAEILAKPSKLSPLEYALVQGHVEAGYEVLKRVNFAWPIADIVHQHHERLDGSGYPQRLRGDEILLEARILAVADVVEAISSHRPYRPGLAVDAALDEIEGGRGIKYDPMVVDACLKMFREKNYQMPV